MGIQIAPSLLAADFTRIADEVAAIGSRSAGDGTDRATGASQGADWLHVDVMDNHFVPNITLGLQMVEAIHRVATVPLDCHLMITDPDLYAPSYVEAGAGSVTFHVEAAAAPVRLARTLRSAGARAGMALRPATPVEPYEDLLPELDMLLLMTVEPGFGGQAFLDVVLPKIRRARALIDRHGGQVWLQVDGGVSLATVERVAEAGADMLVAGTAVYGAADPVAAIEGLRRLATEASTARGTLEPDAKQ
jgi:ribulose-phosphate 3-epimerase